MSSDTVCVSPRGTTFERLSKEWLETYPEIKGLKRSTREGYKGIIEGHLGPAFGARDVVSIGVAQIEAYIAAKHREGLGPGTLNRHLNLLSLLFAAAIRRQCRTDNPVKLVDRPREPRRRWTVLSPDDVRRVEREFLRPTPRRQRERNAVGGSKRALSSSRA